MRGRGMGIIKNDIPILEFDTEQKAVISPVHENLNLKLPKKCVFAFLGNYIDEYADKTDAKQVASFISATKNYPVYITKYKGEEVVLCQAPVGAAAAVQILDWLKAMGSAKSFPPAAAAPLSILRKARFLYQVKHCVMKEHHITMRRLRALWKSAKEQERLLKKRCLSTV